MLWYQITLRLNFTIYNHRQCVEYSDGNLRFKKLKFLNAIIEKNHRKKLEKLN